MSNKGSCSQEPVPLTGSHSFLSSCLAIALFPSMSVLRSLFVKCS